MTTTNGTANSTTVVSRDGTEIAFDQTGSGHPVILVASALSDRTDTAKLATLLASEYTVINYDRRGRGASGDTAPYSVRREIEDIAALVDHAGGSASLFGSSSGAVLALRAAAELDIDRVVAYEPPFVVEGGDFGPPAGFADRIDALLAEDRRSDAVKAFMTEAHGMPKAMVAMMRLMAGMWRKMAAMAPTLPYDLAVMGDTQQAKPLAAEPWSAVTAPTLVLTGGKSPPGFHDAARAIAALLPAGSHRVLDGLNHASVVMAPKKLAPLIADFLRG